MRNLALLIIVLILAAMACDAADSALPTLPPATLPSSAGPITPPIVSPTAASATATPTAQPAATEPLIPVGQMGTVSYIVDGDTIDVIIDGLEYRVRYIGIDTPERDMPYFDQATQANRELVEGQTVLLVKDVSETDRFGRLLRYIYLPDGTFVNAELVVSGYALAATFPPDVAFADLFSRLQEEARQNGRGLWAE